MGRILGPSRVLSLVIVWVTPSRHDRRLNDFYDLNDFYII